jgi:hypothetical protein
LSGVLKELSLTPEEQAKLDSIPREVPLATRRRYGKLVLKRRAEVLDADEEVELVRLSEWIEGVEVKRLEYLSELAHQRGCKLSELIEALNIPTPSYA